MHEKLNPYDLDAVGKTMKQERGVAKVHLAAAHAEVRRRIQRAKSIHICS